MTLYNTDTILNGNYCQHLHNTATGNLIQVIEDEASKLGYKLHRYQTNFSRGCEVTYGLHPTDEDRPAKSAACAGGTTFVGGLEGTTERSQAFKLLMRLNMKLRALADTRASGREAKLGTYAEFAARP